MERGEKALDDSKEPIHNGEPETGEAEVLQEGMNVYHLTQYSLSLYIALAWQMLGYAPDPVSKQIRVDLLQAKIAIDCADYLAGQLRSHLEESIYQEYTRQIRDLKINYLDKQKLSWGENKGD